MFRNKFMRNEVSISDFLWAFKGKILMVVLAVATHAGLGYYAAQKLTPWYSYTFLIRSGKIPSGELTTESTTTDKKNPLKAEYITFLNYEYVENKLVKEGGDAPAYVKSVENIPDTDFINVKIYGRNLEQAQKLGNDMFAKLQEMFAKRIDLEIQSQKRRLELSKETKDTVTKGLQDLSNMQKSFGKNEALDKKRIELESRAETLNFEIIRLEKLLQSGEIRHFEVVSTRPESNKVAFPDPVLFTAAGAMAGLLLACVGLLLALISRPSNNFRRAPVSYYNENQLGHTPSNVVSYSQKTGTDGTNTSYRSR